MSDATKPQKKLTAKPSGGPATTKRLTATSRRKVGGAGKGLSNPVEPVARGFSSSAVYDALRKEILSLQLQPSTLLDETELSERFSLSRSPIREALVRLSAEGLVTTLRNRSTIVAPFDLATVPSYLDAVNLMYRLTSRLAAANRSDKQLLEIKRLSDEHREAADARDISRMIILNREFHATIADATGNAFFAQWTRILLDQGQRILGIYLHDIGAELPTGTLDEHAALVLAIEARNSDAAERAGLRDAEIVAEQMRSRLMARPTTSMRVDGR